MAFDDVWFPTAIAINAAGGPGFKTDIYQTVSGYEQRNIDWSIARGRWDVAHAVKDKSTFATLKNFFMARYGRAHSFRFKDFMDYQATAVLIGTGDGSETQFQLKKLYTSGSRTYSRVITKPVSGTVSLYLGGAEQTEGGGADYTLNYATGVVTFNSAVGNGVAVTWTGQFDCHCRFDTDTLDARVEVPPGSDGEGIVVTWGDIPIVEIKEQSNV